MPKHKPSLQLSGINIDNRGNYHDDIGGTMIEKNEAGTTNPTQKQPWQTPAIVALQTEATNGKAYFFVESSLGPGITSGPS